MCLGSHGLACYTRPLLCLGKASQRWIHMRLWLADYSSMFWSAQTWRPASTQLLSITVCLFQCWNHGGVNERHSWCKRSCKRALRHDHVSHKSSQAPILSEAKAIRLCLKPWSQLKHCLSQPTPPYVWMHSDSSRVFVECSDSHTAGQYFRWLQLKT